MSIRTLRIARFRNLINIDLSAMSDGFNLIYGENGSGKTSLLEAIYYLSHGKSFRSTYTAPLISHEHTDFSIFAELAANETTMRIGVARNLNNLSQIRLNEKDVANMAEITRLMPLRVINAQSHHLFEAGPSYRRKYLDWGLFYQEARFMPCWQLFERALKQRNLILRDKRSRKELDSWTAELIKHALPLDQLRREYIAKLTPIALQMIGDLLDINGFAFTYHPGWDEARDYEAILTTDHSEAYRFGYTQFGPHRADLQVTANKIPVKQFLSRGQQKLLICAMILAQGQLLVNSLNNKKLIYLIDDLPAELDERSRKRLLALLIEQKAQVFITSIAQEEINKFLTERVNLEMFHVEHGQVKKVSMNQAVPLGA